MTSIRRRAITSALVLVGAQLTACAASVSPSDQEVGQASTNSGVVVREDLSQRFIALIGPEVQFAPPYLGTPNTNVSRLRSFLDRKTGETAHQLYVIASYDGNHDWTAAHDGVGQELQFIPISRFQIACEAKDKCSYAEEFAAKFPESELRNNSGGFSVTFTDRAGNAQTIRVSATQVASQLSALADLHRQMAAAPPASTTPAR